MDFIAYSTCFQAAQSKDGATLGTDSWDAMGTAVITVLLSLSVLMNGVQSTRSMYVVLCMLVALQWFSHISLYLFILVMSDNPAATVNLLKSAIWNKV